MTLCDMIADLASSTSDNVALSDVARSVTYAELHARMGRLAGLVTEHGVRPGEVVLIMLERGVALVEAMIAVWRAGAAFLPVDPASPAARTVAASGAALCLTASHLESIGVRRVDLDRVDLDSGDVPTALPGPAPDGLAYVIRTSGSTGLPKLATVTH